MDSLSEDDLDAIERAAAEATPGPWHVDEGFGGVWIVTGGPADLAVHPSTQMPGVVLGGSYRDSYRDADFIVAATDAVLRLTAEVRRLREVEHTMQKMVEDGHPDSAEWFAICRRALGLIPR